MLNKLPHMCNSRHLKRKYMQIMITLLKIKYWLEATSMLTNQKHAGIKTSTTRGWFNCSVKKQLIHLLLNNWMMSCSCLHTELLEVMEQGRMGPMLKMVTLNHIKHKPFRSNALMLCKAALVPLLNWYLFLLCVSRGKFTASIYTYI